MVFGVGLRGSATNGDDKFFKVRLRKHDFFSWKLIILIDRFESVGILR